MGNTNGRGWAATTLGQTIHLQRGYDLPLHSRVPGSVPVIGSGDADGWHNRPMAQGPGVVIGRATNLGRPKFVQVDYWPLNTTLYVKDLRGNDPRWVYYLFQTLDLTGYNSGSVQPMLNRNYIERVPVRLPPLFEQRAIAEVLGALDDKIEANRKIVARASQMMDVLFTKKTETSQSIQASMLLNPVLGGTPSRSVDRYWNGELPWATARDVAASVEGMLTNTAECISEVGLRESPTKLVSRGTTLITARGTVGQLARVTMETAFNQTCYALVPKNGLPPLLLYLSVKAAISHLKVLTHGTIFATITKQTFDILTVKVPTQDLWDELASELGAYDELMIGQLRESQLLSKLRDALVPKLLSGELRVKDAEPLVETAL